MDDPEPSTSPKSSSTPRECEHLHSRIFPVCTFLPHVITHRRPDFFFLWPCSLIPSNCISPACALIHWAACREADSQLHVSCVAYKYFSLALALLHTQPLFWCTFLIMHSPSNLISVAERLTQLWRRLSCHATVWLNHMFLCSCCPRHVSALKHLQEVRDTATSSVRLQFRWNVLETPLITSHLVCLLPSLCLPRLLPPCCKALLRFISVVAAKSTSWSLQSWRVVLWCGQCARWRSKRPPGARTGAVPVPLLYWYASRSASNLPPKGHEEAYWLRRMYGISSVWPGWTCNREFASH